MCEYTGCPKPFSGFCRIEMSLCRILVSTETTLIVYPKESIEMVYNTT